MLEVEFIHIRMNTSGGGVFLALTDADIRKYGEQTGLDILVVHTVNDDD